MRLSIFAIRPPIIRYRANLVFNLIVISLDITPDLRITSGKPRLRGGGVTGQR